MLTKATGEISESFPGEKGPMYGITYVALQDNVSDSWIIVLSCVQAKVLMKSVDDVSLGMGGAADTLFISARSGDKGLLAEQSKSIQTLASSLHDIAHDSMERYPAISRAHSYL